MPICGRDSFWILGFFSLLPIFTCYWVFLILSYLLMSRKISLLTVHIPKGLYALRNTLICPGSFLSLCIHFSTGDHAAAPPGFSCELCLLCQVHDVLAWASLSFTPSLMGSSAPGGGQGEQGLYFKCFCFFFTPLNSWFWVDCTSQWTVHCHGALCSFAPSVSPTTP